MLPLAFEGRTVRTLEIDGTPWFVGKDVCEVLGYRNHSKALNDHTKGGNETVLPSAGGPQTVRIIPEQDVYRLIMRSRLPAAERFEEWVVSEVLPAIRKTGGYGEQGRILEALVEAQTQLSAAVEKIANSLGGIGHQLSRLEDRVAALEARPSLPAPEQARQATLPSQQPAGPRRHHDGRAEPAFVTHAGTYAGMRGCSRETARTWNACGLIVWVRDPHTPGAWLVDVAATDERRRRHEYGMVYESPVAVQLTRADLTMLETLKDVADDGWVEGVAQADLAAKAGLKFERAKLCLKRLEVAGRIETSRSGSSGTKTYQITD